jgi:hypothetical protein
MKILNYEIFLLSALMPLHVRLMPIVKKIEVRKKAKHKV